LNHQISQGTCNMQAYCRWGGSLCGVYIENFLTKQLVKNFWKSVHICRSYYQATSGWLFWETVYRNSVFVRFPMLFMK